MTDKSPLREIVATLDALEAKATPGPWEFKSLTPDWDGDATYDIREGGKEFSCLMGDSRYYNTALEKNDAEFVTALRNAWPALRAAVDARRRLEDRPEDENK